MTQITVKRPLPARPPAGAPVRGLSAARSESASRQWRARHCRDLLPAAADLAGPRRHSIRRCDVSDGGSEAVLGGQLQRGSDPRADVHPALEQPSAVHRCRGPDRGRGGARGLSAVALPGAVQAPFMYGVLFGTCLPITAIMVPVYSLFVQLNLLDSLPGHDLLHGGLVAADRDLDDEELHGLGADLAWRRRHGSTAPPRCERSAPSSSR